MKIHDITDENLTNEAAGVVARTVAKLAEPAVAKAGSWVASKVAPNIGKTGKPAKSIKDIWLRGGAKIGKPITTFSKLTGRALIILKYYGLYQIYKEYEADMEAAKAKLASGAWTQADYDAFHKNAMSVFVTQIAASTTFFLALKVISGWSLLVLLLKMSKNPVAVAAGTTLATLATGTQVALINMMNQKEVRMAIADFTAKMGIDDTLGGTALESWQALKELIGVAEKKAKGEGEPEEKDDKPTEPPKVSNPSSSAPGSAANTGKTSGDLKAPNPMFKGID